MAMKTLGMNTRAYGDKDEEQLTHRKNTHSHHVQFGLPLFLSLFKSTADSTHWYVIEIC